MLNLIDLSNNNPGPIDFHKVRHHGVYGVWMKVTEGDTFIDPDWHTRATQARAAGLHVGGYHFARPAVGGAAHQADYFCEQLGRVERRDLHPVLDLEKDGNLEPMLLYGWARVFLARVHENTGVKCLTYSSPSFIAARNWPRTFGTGCGLWLAQYGPNDGKDHGATAPPPWTGIVAHQYTSRGTCPGVTGLLDCTHAKTRRKILAHGLTGIY